MRTADCAERREAKRVRIASCPSCIHCIEPWQRTDSSSAAPALQAGVRIQGRDESRPGAVNHTRHITTLKLVLRNWFTKPRWKTYAAQSGYVYQYVFEGVRGDDSYVFRAVSGPKIEMTLEVVLETQALGAWVLENRSLTQMELYGIAKMALMRALDLEPVPHDIRPGGAEVVAICRELDL